MCEMTTYGANHAVVFPEGTAASQKAGEEDEDADDDQGDGDGIARAGGELHVVIVFGEDQGPAHNDHDATDLQTKEQPRSYIVACA